MCVVVGRSLLQQQPTECNRFAVRLGFEVRLDLVGCCYGEIVKIDKSLFVK